MGGEGMGYGGMGSGMGYGMGSGMGSGMGNFDIKCSTLCSQASRTRLAPTAS